MIDGAVRWPAEFDQRYRYAGYWQGLTFGRLLRSWVQRSGTRTALVDDRHRLSYREVDARVDGLAAGLRELGLRRDDRVVLRLPNTVDFVLVWFACQRLGAVPVHAMPGHRAAEITHLAQLSEAVAYVIPDRHARFDYRRLADQVRATVNSIWYIVVAGVPGDGHVALSSLAHGSEAWMDDPADEPDASDVAMLLLSGGTTGVPKLIPRTHNDYAYNARAAAEICAMSDDAVYLAVLPVAFNFTLSCPGILGALTVGGTVVVADSPDPGTAFRLVEQERVTITALNPPLTPMWIAEAGQTDYNLSSLRVVQIGSARLADEAARRVEPALGATLQQVFGMAEGLLNLTRLDDPAELRCTTQGRPISPADEIRVVDPDGRTVPPGQTGELYTRGPYTLRGYFRDSEHNATAFTSDGFYRTGDVVRALLSGHLMVVGRVKEQINRGGEKIATAEVEGHLIAHPAVHGAAVVGVADERWGERSVAFLVCSPEPVTRSELVAFLRERGLAAYKHPDQVELIEQFPLTPIGKIDKNALRETLGGPASLESTGGPACPASAPSL